MDQEQLWAQHKQKLMSCLVHEEARCTSACPLHLDVRAWIEKVQDGRMDAAYRYYMNAVGFPGIVSRLCSEPCAAECLMASHGGPLNLKRLEQTVAARSKVKPHRYPMPQKAHAIAIVGGGLSGLGCALRLCNRKYAVTLFEQTDQLGGRALRLMPPEQVQADIERQFQFEQPQFRLNSRIETPEALLKEGFSAVYVAVGENSGLSLPAPLPGGAAPFATEIPGVFLGGGLTGADPIEALAQGLEAATLMEGYLKSGVMRSGEPYRQSKLKLNDDKLKNIPAVLPAEGELYTDEEAVEEASRCMKCRCEACLEGCGLMKNFGKTPMRIAEEVDGTLHPGSLGGEMTLAMRFLSSCDQCGFCRDSCPEKIDIGEFLLESREILRKKEKLPWAFFDYWLRDMDFSCKDTRLELVGETDRPGHVFFPGCQLGGSDPAYVEKAFEAVKNYLPDTALLMSCCGAPALWAGEKELHEQVLEGIRSFWHKCGEPEFILACPTCEKMFRQYLPEIPVQSILVLLEQKNYIPKKNGHGEILQMFDPCAARNHEPMKESARKLAERAGYTVREWQGPAVCCTYGGDGSMANPAYTDFVARERAEQSPLPYLTYCANCRDVFASKGKAAWHLFDLLFDINSAERPAPGATLRRYNRRRLAALGKGEAEPRECALLMTEEVRRKLDASYILAEDLEEIIRNAEEKGSGLRDPESGDRICYGRLGNMTYWARYRQEGDAIRLLTAYSHRMTIKS